VKNLSNYLTKLLQLKNRRLKKTGDGSATGLSNFYDNWTPKQINLQSSLSSLLASIHKIVAECPEDFGYLNGTLFAVQKKTLVCQDKDRWFGLGESSQTFSTQKNSASNDASSSIVLSVDAVCKNKASEAKVPTYFMVFRNSKLFMQQDGPSEDKNKETLAEGKNGDKQKTEKTNRCKKNFLPTNKVVLTSVVLDKVESVLTEIRFKKGNVSSFLEWKQK
jgi:hypothetical protein